MLAGDGAPRRRAGEDEAPVCRLSTPMNYAGLRALLGSAGKGAKEAFCLPPAPTENLRPGLRDGLSN